MPFDRGPAITCMALCIPMHLSSLQKQLTFITYLLVAKPYGKHIRERTCPIACGKHMWNLHVEQFPHKFFSFHGMFPLCAVKTYVENIPWKPGLKCEIRVNMSTKLLNTHP